MKRYLKKGVIFVLIFALCISFTSCGKHKGFDPSDGGGGGSFVNPERRLFDDISSFIATVKRNLSVPDKQGITWSVGDPYFADVYGLEIVCVTFYENGETAAFADCATKDGSLVSSIYIYREKEEDATSKINSNPQYFTYKNERFGYIINYPDFLNPQKEATGGAEKSFISDDGKIKLVTWGSFFPVATENVGTIDEFYDYVASNLEYEPTYTAKKNTYFVFTGYIEDRIVYEKHFIKSDKTESAFRIEYPSYLREELYDVVEYISNTMTTGSGYDSQAEK